MPFPLLFHRLLPFGRRSEIHAIGYLRSLGYQIVTSGFRTKGGEVDVIAWDGDVLVFIEVKARRGLDRPEDNVGFTKQQRIIRAAQAYLSKHRLHETPYRFDILAVTALPGARPEFRLLRDAFDTHDTHG
jgi:putative endonuclease